MQSDLKTAESAHSYSGSNQPRAAFAYGCDLIAYMLDHAGVVIPGSLASVRTLAVMLPIWSATMSILLLHSFSKAA